jgi:hypothetical protein
MEMSAKAKKRPSEQVKEFRQAARELGCDENEERFQTALRAVAKHRPKEKSKSDKIRK